MILLFWITASFIVICLAYPLWLMVLPASIQSVKAGESGKDGVSLIIPCYNEQQKIRNKIKSLLNELACFKAYELIVIDNCSTDSTREILREFKEHPKVKLILKEKQMGIPHSLNLGVSMAKYDRVVFSDVRQQLTCNVIRRLVNPLNDPDIGAVSTCLAARSGKKSYSVLRGYENFLKKLESRTGNLIGVYGPLYAIRKECFRPIPQSIILDDLYNGLSILGIKKVIIVDNCRIMDEDFSKLYDYRRSRRYLLGFLQILLDRSLISKLDGRQRIMLFWHKYIRLLIPLLILACYVVTGILGLNHPGYLILFGFMTLLGFLSVWPALNKYNFKLMDFVRINVYYMGAMIDILINRSFQNIPSKTTRKKNNANKMGTIPGINIEKS